MFECKTNFAFEHKYISHLYDSYGCIEKFGCLDG